MSGNVFPTPTLQWGTLLQDPTTSMQVATKEYVDSKVGGTGYMPLTGGTLSGPLSIQPPTINWSGSASSPTNLEPFSVSTGFAGTSTASGGINLNQIQVTDTIAGQPNVPHNMLYLNLNVGAGMVGNPQALAAYVSQQATTGNGAAGGYYNAVAGFFGSYASFNEGGTTTSAKGTVFGSNPLAQLNSGATFFQEVCGEEVNVAIATGASAIYKAGVNIVKLSIDAVRGSWGWDAALGIADQPGTSSSGSWTYGILFGNEGSAPACEGGTFIASRMVSGSVPQNVAWDLDFFANNASGGLIRGNNFAVDGSGNLSIGTAIIKPLASGLSIDASVYQAASATIAAGGSNYAAGWHVADTAGNIWTISSTGAGGSVTGVTLWRAVSSASQTTPLSLVTLAFITPPASGCSLNVTYHAGTTLSLQPSGGPAVFGGTVTAGTAAPSAPQAGTVLGTNVAINGYGAVGFNTYTDGAGNWFRYAAGYVWQIAPASNGTLGFNYGANSTAGSLAGFSQCLVMWPDGGISMLGNVAISGNSTLSNAVTIQAGGLTVSAGGINLTGAGMSFGAQTGVSNTDISKHLILHTAGFGMGITSNRQNYVVAGPATHVFICNSIDTVTISPSSLAVAGSLAAAAPTTHAGTAYTVAVGDSALLLAPTGTMTLTLLAAATYPGRMLWLKLTTAFAVNSATANVVPIAGGAASTAIMTATAGKYCLLVSDGTNWQLMQAN